MEASCAVIHLNWYILTYCEIMLRLHIQQSNLNLSFFIYMELPNAFHISQMLQCKNVTCWQLFDANDVFLNQ